MKSGQTIGRAMAMGCGLMLAGCASEHHGPPQPVAAPVAKVTTEQLPPGSFKVGKPYEINGRWYYPSEDYTYVEEGIASWYGQDFHGKKTANGEPFDMNAVTAAHRTLPMPSMVRVTNLDNGRTLEVRINDRGPFARDRILDLSRRSAQLLGMYETGTAHVRVEIDVQESMNLKNVALKKNPPEMPVVASAPREAISAMALEPVMATPGEIASSSLPAPASKSAAITPAVKSEPVKQAASAPKAPAKVASNLAPKAPAKAPSKPAQAVAKKPTATETQVASNTPIPSGPGIFIQAGAFSDAANATRQQDKLRELGAVNVSPVTINNVKLFRVRLGPIANAAAADALLARVKSFGYNGAKVIRE